MPGAWRAARLALDPHRREAGPGTQALYGPDPNTSLENDAICGLRSAQCRVFGAISYERVDWVLEALVDRRVAPASGTKRSDPRSRTLGARDSGGAHMCA